MKGKIGLVIGLGAGYVLGTRAGRERYEQIKEQALKVWNLDPVQQQVSKVQDFAKSSVAALPSALWDGAVKVTKAAAKQGTPGQKLDSAIKAGKASADDIEKAAEKTRSGLTKAAEDARDEVAKATEKARNDVSKAVDDAVNGVADPTLPSGQI
ncbi:MAG TPA: hypothetical protein VNT50_05325 [Microbacterium sp.]|uniref:hypothetical protein n=1 Tax=Microbacterium sp. TaxID=51671 RepID=UPI002B978594|nr:hypothetical protein [Microbacterium sp.]HWI30887.1 hypothetical protein [Microbacterium sp.]